MQSHPHYDTNNTWSPSPPLPPPHRDYPSSGYHSPSPLLDSSAHQPGFRHIPNGDYPNGDMEKSEHKRKRKRMADRNGCARCLCCACCLPLWATCILWFIIIAIIIVVLVLGTIFATFTMPTIDMAGVTSSPNNGSQISFHDDTFSINFGLLIHINNPNLLKLKLSNINATAYYPPIHGSSKTPVGGGFVQHLDVPKYTDFNFTFPFAIVYSPTFDRDQSVLNSIANKCGLTGGSVQDITVDYTIQLTAKVLFVTVHPTIDSSSTFKCPLTNNGLPSLDDGLLIFAIANQIQS
ncbi:uncharacterized protein BYT42DRAFT_587910 [Radiomyces spectabilis]|uniref:uncharacterized protein n=1 Tax=Radiomyces spectabilis TaxID=64574 RepID=UPI00221F0D2E|nr:uncharacterized protein BYT42DRAFT_587910 [Radiomyces spectabilis]KAI8366798.1 hypothetical protein BYT42DRAFT_587910 [Radiomyces spectabilis]